MFNTRLKYFVRSVFFLVCLGPAGQAQNLKITIPLRSQLTPVQRLNREGVDAVLKHNFQKAEGYFYKAYLFDPADPFTLNNLGYVSEIQGRVDRAEEFYTLAEKQGCDALIDRTSVKQLKGKSMMYALDTLKNAPMRVNRENILGMELLSQDRPFEAVALLREALAHDSSNPFTLNNLGVAEESVGDYQAALRYYDQAASSRSMQPVMASTAHAWQGKPVSEMAASSAGSLRARMEKMEPSRIRSGMLAMRGVSALNRNDWNAAKHDFLDAYAIDPRSAFSLNNRGYVAEHDGDLETAKSFYERAKRAGDAGERVGMATSFAAHGRNLGELASESDEKVDSQLTAYSESRRGQPVNIQLKRRDGAPAAPAKSTPEALPTPQNETSAPPPPPQ